ncbi:hypothetical protein PR202_ga13698 [Eleusine coracana subsp. coracana]|uniref:Protein ARV n=1 Tax=Eleusine coracana subsp. coracana TaxID=191504 RepID=A0AAV5CFF8_ELECO|nr:hypothetical protein PR202_ga13698 [Eleusine coracana subsp. coracana]
MGDAPSEEEGPRCVGCGRRVRTLFVQYSPGNIRLMKCDSCKAVADPYIECEFMIILIDLILHKTRAYRHLLVNKLAMGSSVDKVWEFPSSVIFIVEMFVLSSNVVALREMNVLFLYSGFAVFKRPLFHGLLHGAWSKIPDREMDPWDATSLNPSISSRHGELAGSGAAAGVARGGGQPARRAWLPTWWAGAGVGAAEAM